MLDRLAWAGFLLGTGFFAGIGIFLSIGWAMDDNATRGTLRGSVVATVTLLYCASLFVSEDRLVAHGLQGIWVIVLGAFIGGALLVGALSMYRSR